MTLVLNLTSLSEHLLKAKVPHKVIPRDARFPHIKLGLLGFHKSSWVYWVLQTDHKAPWHLSSASPDYKMLALVVAEVHPLIIRCWHLIIMRAPRGVFKVFIMQRIKVPWRIVQII